MFMVYNNWIEIYNKIEELLYKMGLLGTSMGLATLSRHVTILEKITPREMFTVNVKFFHISPSSDWN